VIDVVDYDARDAVFKRMRNDEFIGIMREQYTAPSSKAPPRRVRWINIGGIDWGVLSTLALRYSQFQILASATKHPIFFFEQICTLCL